jgi:TM2 domain-containing membrane protein YozV
MTCAYHLTNRAVVQCSRCSRPLCPACDHRIRGFPHCQDCIVSGVELLQQQQARAGLPKAVRRKTSPFVALLLSFVVPGLGAAYNGQTSKAIVHFTIFASFFQMATVTDGTAFFILGVVGTWLFAAVDAVRTAQLIRSGLAPDAESDAIARRLYGNPLAWAVTMITLGTVFLLHTLFGVRLPIEKSLPVLLVLLGAYMLFDYVRARRKREVVNFDAFTRPPSVVGHASSSLGEATRFGTGELVTQVSARESSLWPTDPRG